MHVEVNKPVVPVFGAYFNGNFGDDLMAHMIAGRLAGEGYSPRLWRGPTDAFRGHAWPVANDVDGFLEGARCVVCGGGMILGDSNYREYWDDFHAVADACISKSIPMLAISVGGDGASRQLNPVVQKLVDAGALRAVSCRLDTDVGWLTSLGVSARYIPDIVLTAGTHRTRHEIKKVLFVLAVHPLEKILLERACSRLNAQGIKVYTMGQRIDGASGSRRAFHGKTERIENRGLHTVMQTLSDVDAVVASGLHMGVAALSCGAQFISYRGAGKTREFLRECGLEDASIQGRGLHGKLLSAYRLPGKISRLKPFVPGERFSELRKGADEHYDFMLHHLAKILSQA